MSAEHIAIDIEARARAIGLSIEELCRRADKAPTTFRRMRDGDHSPTLSTIDAFKKVIEKEEKRLGITEASASGEQA